MSSLPPDIRRYKMTASLMPQTKIASLCTQNFPLMHQYGTSKHNEDARIWLRPRSHRRRRCSQMLHAKNGTHCSQWECSHNIAGNIKGFACKFAWKPAYASCVNGDLTSKQLCKHSHHRNKGPLPILSRVTDTNSSFSEKGKEMSSSSQAPPIWLLVRLGGQLTS